MKRRKLELGTEVVRYRPSFGERCSVAGMHVLGRMLQGMTSVVRTLHGWAIIGRRQREIRRLLNSLRD